jgi:signal transduction histidine kinase
MPSAQSKIAWLAFLGLLPIGLLHLVHLVDTPNRALDAYAVESMRFVESQATTPPVEADWRRITADTLIDAPIRRDRFNSSWIAIDPPYGTGVRLGVYLPYPQANAAVYLGDRFVGSGGAMERPLPFYMRSLYVPLPADVDRTETIYLHIARERGYLEANGVIVGPHRLLADQYRTDRLVNLWLPGIVATLMLGLALSMFVMYLMSTRHFAYFGLYAVIVVLWALHTIHGLMNFVPFHHWTWKALIYLLLWWAILTPAFANQFFELGYRRLETATIAGGALLTLPIFWLLFDFRIEALYDYYRLGWVPYVLLCSICAFCLYAIASWRYWSFEALGLYFVAAIGLIFGVRDHLFDFYPDMPGTTYYTKFVAMGQIAFINLLIARRYSRSERDLVLLNRELEDRVDEKARELEAGYEERRVLERQKTLAEERERLMRDMHDGLGGQLIQALAVSEQAQAPRELRESLERALIDLRLIVDSISPEQDDLVSLLASFRHRSQRVWEKSGIRLHWNMRDVPEIRLGPEASLHVLRIVQEASTNALKHSGAANVRFAASHTDGEIRVEIEDDGKGFDPDAVHNGHGLANMRRRAAEAGVRLSIDSGGPGTRIVIGMPA